MVPLIRAGSASLAAVFLLAVPPKADAHSWYSTTCCSGQDCSPLEPQSVKATGVGWEILETGEVIPYGDRREQFSQDSDFHRCAFQAGELKGRTRCLYVPGAGM